MRKLFGITFVIVVALAACQGASDRTVRPGSAPPASQPTLTIPPIAPSLAPTKPAPSKTSTEKFLPSPTSTAYPMNTVQSFCPSIEPVSSLPEIEGQLIMNGINPNPSPDLSNVEIDYLLNLKTSARQSLSTKNFNDINLPFYLDDGSALVSPDRSRFAYVEYGTPDYQNPDLRIINSAGEQEPTPGWGEGWDKIYGWADNQTFLFTVDEFIWIR